MPTIIVRAGRRLFFYSNEISEPIHVNAEKSEMECKFWIDVDDYELIEAFSYKLTPQAKREIKKTIYDHFDYIVHQWNKYLKAR